MEKLSILLLLIPLVTTSEENLEEFISGSNLLTSDIYKQMTQNFQSNFLVSPFSLQTVLALTHSGAKGATAEELRRGLRLPNTKEKVENVFQDILPQLKSNDFLLRTANKIYVKEDFPISGEFEKTAKDVYEAGLENTNFEKQEEAAKTINQWVETQTRNKIREIISPQDLDRYTRLVLINAIYFKGNWSSPFKALGTSPEDFYKTETEVVKVDTMHGLKYFNYFECSDIDAKILEIPFRGEEASMVIVLLNKRNGIGHLENNIEKVFTPRNFSAELVKVALPKFKIETTIQFKKILENLGIKKVFKGNESDLSEISTKNENLAVSKVLQKTFIDVSEDGVEAAAATTVFVNIIATSAIRPPEPQKFFKADHPFIFYIKFRGVVLFGGRVSVPNVSKSFE